MTIEELIKQRWPIIALVTLPIALLSFCTAHRLYVLETKPPEYIYKEVPVQVEVAKPCPPVPECTPQPPPPFNISVIPKKSWNSDGEFQACYQIDIPADGQWHDSRVSVSPGTRVIWNYAEPYSGGLSLRVGSFVKTEYVPLDYEKAFYKYDFVRAKTDYEQYERNDVMLDAKRSLEFKAFEKDLTIIMELLER